jgi:prepilin-type N-terminal cleavage/methylation domain-containing protein
MCQLRAAFTLLELLVGVGVLAILLALTIPMLGEARMIAKENAVLAHQRAVTAELQRFTTDHRGWYPYYGVPGTAEAPIDYPPREQNPGEFGTFDPDGLYWGQPLAWWWKLELDGYEGALARQGPEVPHDWDITSRPWNAVALDWMMHAAFATPWFFDGERPPDIRNHQPMPEHTVAYPGAKGLLIRWNAVRRVHDAERWNHFVHFVDGHGERLRLDEMLPAAAVPAFLDATPVLTTKDGVLGRDK